MRRLWRVSKLFNLPISDKRIQDLTEYELEYYELSTILDDPELLRAYKNRFVDSEYDDWEKEFDEEQRTKSKNAKFDQENSQPNPSIKEDNTTMLESKSGDEEVESEYEISLGTDVADDWEVVK